MDISKLHKVLRDTGSISVNKKLAKEIGLHEAIMYSEIASKYKYFADRKQLTSGGYFYNTVENMQEDTTLSRYQQKKAIDNLVKLDLIDYELGSHNGRSTRLFRIKDRISILRRIFQGVDITELEDTRVKKLATNNTNISGEKFNPTTLETSPDHVRNFTRPREKLATNNTKDIRLKNNTKKEEKPRDINLFFYCKESIKVIYDKLESITGWQVVEDPEEQACKLYEYMEANGGNEKTLDNFINGLDHLNEYWKSRIRGINDIFKGDAIKEISIKGKENKRKSKDPWKDIEVEYSMEEIRSAADERNQEVEDGGEYGEVDFLNLYKQKKGKSVENYLREPLDRDETTKRKEEVLNFIKEYKYKTTEHMKKHLSEVKDKAVKELGFQVEGQLYELAREYGFDIARMEKNAVSENDFISIVDSIKKIKSYEIPDKNGYIRIKNPTSKK